MATCIHSSRSCLPPFYTIPIFPLLNRKIFHLLVAFIAYITYNIALSVEPFGAIIIIVQLPMCKCQRVTILVSFIDCVWCVVCGVCLRIIMFGCVTVYNMCVCMCVWGGGGGGGGQLMYYNEAESANNLWLLELFSYPQCQLLC